MIPVWTYSSQTPEICLVVLTELDLKMQRKNSIFVLILKFYFKPNLEISTGWLVLETSPRIPTINSRFIWSACDAMEVIQLGSEALSLSHSTAETHSDSRENQQEKTSQSVSWCWEGTVMGKGVLSRC